MTNKIIELPKGVKLSSIVPPPARDFSIPLLVRLLQIRLEEWLLMTAGAPCGFVRAIEPTVIQMGIVREDSPGKMRILATSAEVSPAEMNGQSEDQGDLHFNYLFQEMLDAIESEWTL